MLITLFIERAEYIKKTYGFEIKKYAVDSGYLTLDIKKYFMDNNIFGVFGYRRYGTQESRKEKKKYMYNKEQDYYIEIETGDLEDATYGQTLTVDLDEVEKDKKEGKEEEKNEETTEKDNKEEPKEEEKKEEVQEQPKVPHIPTSGENNQNNSNVPHIPTTNSSIPGVLSNL